MYAEWITSANGLPREGQQIEFLLDCRSIAMEGSYTHQAFRSHWAEYDVDRVRSWRGLAEVCDLATPAQNQVPRVLIRAPRDDTSHHPLPAAGMAHAA